MKSKLLLASLLFISTFSFATTFTIGFGGTIGMAYDPNMLTVSVGDTVTWMGDFATHPLQSTSVPAGANSFSNSSGSTFSYAILFAGDYNFQCAIHGFSGKVTATGGGTAVTSITKKDAIEIFPTVVKTFLKINIPAGSKILFAEVKNIVGQTAVKTNLANNSVNTIDMSSLYPGYYFVAIRDDEDVVKVVRVIKE